MGVTSGFQFLGIPPKGEPDLLDVASRVGAFPFPISRDPPEGGTTEELSEVDNDWGFRFPISRDPPEGGTAIKASAAPDVTDVSNF